MIGRIVGRLVLTAFYFLIVTPAALVRRLVSGNPLEHPATDKGYWQPHVAARPGAEDMRRPS